MSKKQIPFKHTAKPISPIDPKDSRKLKLILGIIIAAFAFLLYAQSISFDYVLDDITVTKDNKFVTQGIAGIPEILITDYWYGYSVDLRCPEYRPASVVMFAIEWQLFPHNSHVNHFMNVLLFALTCLILFLVLCKLFDNQSILFPFVCSLLYAAHPIHTEVVDYIKSRDEILCFLFGISAIYFAFKYIFSKSNLSLILLFVLYFLCLSSKETGITFLIIIPLAIFFFTKTEPKRIGIIFLLLAIETTLFLLIRHKVLEGVDSSIFNTPINNTLFSTRNFIEQRATAFYVLLKYVLLLIFPYSLSSEYGYLQIPIQNLSNIAVIIAIAVYFGIGIYAVINIRRKSVAAFAILFYLVTLAPVSNIFILIGSVMAERFLYIPSLGFCILLTYLLLQIKIFKSDKNNFKTVKEFFTLNSRLFLIVIIITGYYSIRTIIRNADWENDVTISSKDVVSSPNSAREHSNWGTEILMDLYFEAKTRDIQNVMLDSAIEEFNKAINIFPNNDKDYLELAIAYQYKGDSIDAIKNYEKNLLFHKKPAKDIYRNLGRLYQKTGQYDKALSLADTALKYIPDSNVYNNKGAALVALGRYEEAIQMFQKAIDISDKDTAVYQNMGSAYGNLKNFPKAVECFLKAYNLDSTDADNAYFIGVTYNNMGDQIKAKYYLEKANKLKVGQAK